MSRSLLLTLDTKYAKEDTSTTTTTTTTTKPDVSLEGVDTHLLPHHDNEADNSIELDNDDAAAALLGVKITLISSQRLEAVLGLCTALVIFFAVTVLLVRRRSRSRETRVDKQHLLTHEVLSPDYVRVSFSN